MFLQLTAEEKQAIMNEIKRFYLEERGEEIGDIAAIQTFEFVKEKLGPYFYNQALKDSRRVVEEKASAIEEELFALEKRL
ncbi:DUF2164 domain-containing protein [Bacillus sonorensis]|uniref:DUF2164 domain-containing protein n=2 Tax=Bacillus sonorensis TaxID=119858 RepID=M5PEK8_9BACI|nr:MULTISPECIES: DUF2164 domain-containing protein [Bacillus]TWK84299.1 hypothetical protein CHCC20335_4367 [Bacillus paralicheniformis]ASB89080.1 hypothetical protein S101395_02573 [Bacillus sonorensis]EME75695.1 hypothetical protein BSONL12_05253 [Bacillus sonorensis L12]MBG9915041.1 hypothetical protein [Bacillus sonorensis]MCF7618424.1 DUF2164 domain-containing protein [Bacillus sonorensis]